MNVKTEQLKLVAEHFQNENDELGYNTCIEAINAIRQVETMAFLINTLAQHIQSTEGEVAIAINALNYLKAQGLAD